MSCEYVVIGAGVSGMTAALLLAEYGKKVALVEKSRTLAPLLRGFKRKGTHFDTGFHYGGALLPGHTLERYLRRLGLIRDLEIVPFDENGFDYFQSIEPAVESSIPYGFQRLKETLSRRFPHEQSGIERYLNEVERTYNSSPFLNPEKDFDEHTGFELRSGCSLQEYLDKCIHDPQLRCLLTVHCLLYGVEPAEVPFKDHAHIIGSYYVSTAGIRGGGLAVAKAYKRRIAECGIESWCGSGARSIDFSPAGRITGVTLDNGERLETQNVIMTAHPSLLPDMVPEGIFRPVFRKRLQNLQNTMSAFFLFGVADARPEPLNGRSYWLLPHMDVPQYFSTPMEATQNPVYVATSEPEGKAKRYGLVFITPMHEQNTAAWADSRIGRRPDEYLQFKQTYADAVEDHMRRHCPDLMRGVDIVEAGTLLTLRDYVNAPTAGVYGVKHTVNQINPLPVTKVEGLYMAGQAVVAPGLLGAIVSAYLTCGIILGKERLLQEMRQC